MVVVHQSVTKNATMTTSRWWHYLPDGITMEDVATTSGNGRSVVAMVVNECDSIEGCDEDHDYQPPCPNNIVNASKALWKAFEVHEDNWRGIDITWADA